jgi:hypothetical protein
VKGAGGWLQIGGIALVVFFVLRVGFDIPFWVVAITVVVLSMVGSILLRPADVPVTPVSHDPTAVDPAAPPQVVRGEPFVLSEDDLAAGRGVSGFMATSGQGVGGGRFPLIELELSERVVLAVSGGRGSSFVRASLGYITLTDRRLIFTGERPLFDLLFFLPGRANLRQLSLPYRGIEDLRLAKRFNFGMLLGSLRPAVVIRTRDRQEHVFWPNVFNLLAFIDRIEDLRKVS